MTFDARYGGFGKWWWHTPRHKWFEYSPNAPLHLPKVPGCYVLILDGMVVYVGQAMNLNARFYKHQIKHLGNNKWKTLWGELTGDLRLKVKYGQRYGDWCMREARLIHRLKPIYNKRLV